MVPHATLQGPRGLLSSRTSAYLSLMCHLAPLSTHMTAIVRPALTRCGFPISKLSMYCESPCCSPIPGRLSCLPTSGQVSPGSVNCDSNGAGLMPFLQQRWAGSLEVGVGGMTVTQSILQFPALPVVALYQNLGGR
jgi:hypothetical protein